MVEKFHYLRIGIGIVLVFIGVKMMLVAWSIEISIPVALAVVAAVLLCSVIASLVWPTAGGRRQEAGGGRR